jgi:hypothetical protein
MACALRGEGCKEEDAHLACSTSTPNTEAVSALSHIAQPSPLRAQAMRRITLVTADSASQLLLDPPAIPGTVLLLLSSAPTDPVRRVLLPVSARAAP